MGDAQREPNNDTKSRYLRNAGNARGANLCCIYSTYVKLTETQTLGTDCTKNWFYY